jgi:hypothetical protein
VVIINGDFTELVRIKRIATFRWYKPKQEVFDGINLKIGSFNGAYPIFPQILLNFE